MGEALLSDLDAFEPIEKPRPASPGPLALAAALTVLVAGIGAVLLLIWQWREESRETLATLQATMVSERQMRAIVAERGARDAGPREPAIARAVVDLIKIELPPLISPIALVPAEAPPPPRPEPETDLMLRQTVPFPRSGSDGDGEIERAIRALTAEWRKHAANGACTLAVDGHTDTKGSDDANLLLSERRAQFVAKILAREFSSTRIAAHGWGERRLLILTPDATEELANRRVEVTLTCPTTAVAMN